MMKQILFLFQARVLFRFQSFLGAMILSLTLSNAGVLASPSIPSGEDKCQRLIDKSNLQSENLDPDIDLAQQWMKDRFSRYPSLFSMRFKRGMVRTASKEVGPVISFGSGPDIFTPLINFPMAQKIHLVDSFAGWGRGSGHVLRELILRMRAIHPDIQIHLLQEGFLKSLPDFIQDGVKGELNGHSSSMRSLVESSAFSEFVIESSFDDLSEKYHQMWLKPLVIRLNWIQEGLGAIERDIYIHFVHDYHHDFFLSGLEQSLGSHPLSGLIVEGAPFPNGLAGYLNRLSGGGLALLEVFSDVAAQRELLSKAKSQMHFSARLVHMETYQRYGNSMPIEMKLYVLKRKKTASSYKPE